MLAVGQRYNSSDRRLSQRKPAVACVVGPASLMLADNALTVIVRIFLIMYIYTFWVFGRRARAFWPSTICLYARRGCCGG